MLRRRYAMPSNPMLVACPAPSVPGCPVHRRPRRAAPPRGPTTIQASGWGCPENGSGSLAGVGRRIVALLLDWLIGYGLAGLACRSAGSASKRCPPRCSCAGSCSAWCRCGCSASRPASSRWACRWHPSITACTSASAAHSRAAAGRARRPAAVHRHGRSRHPGQGDRDGRRPALVTSAEPCAARRASSPPTAAAPSASPRVPSVNPARPAATPASPSA